MLIPYYAERMETHMNPAAGFASVGASFLWPDGSGNIRGDGHILQQVHKSASNNIYLYLADSLKDAALSLVVALEFSVFRRRLSGTIARLFCAHTRALPLR